MTRFFLKKEILFSIVVGVLVALTVETIHWYFRYQEKQEIQTSISEVLSGGFHKIKNAQDYKVELGEEATTLFSADVMRAANYESMQRTLSSLLNYSAGRLNLEDEIVLRNTTLDMETIIEQSTLSENRIFPLEFYEQYFFQKLEEEINWLDFDNQQ